MDFLADAAARAVPLDLVTPEGLAAWRETLPSPARRWLDRAGFKASAGAAVALPDAEGELGRAALGLGEAGAMSAVGAAPTALPQGAYRIATPLSAPDATAAAIAWGRGAYSYDRYRKPGRAPAQLVAPQDANLAEVACVVAGVALARDLVNAPANDMGPEELEAAARDLARAHGAEARVIIGDDLLAQNYPMIHAVGRASARAPRLIDLRWGRVDAPKVTLVGKGVCFDSGGLDIKPSSGMRLMKKDMGGAANVLGLASMVMAAGLDVRLRVLIPAVENAVGGRAFRPGDVIATRKGLTVEIGNTDAEGRLVLADALAEGDAEAPDLMIDMATLTGAARVALGPDLPPLYTRDDGFAAELAAAGAAVEDPMWRMPLWAPYDADLSSKIADLGNITANGFAGSVTAALFLGRFVEKAKVWAHLDIFAWVPVAKPGRPFGGADQVIRALHALLSARYGRG